MNSEQFTGKYEEFDREKVRADLENIKAGKMSLAGVEDMSSNFMETQGRAEIDINSLQDEDLKMYERLRRVLEQGSESTRAVWEDFRAYQQSVSENDTRAHFA